MVAAESAGRRTDGGPAPSPGGGDMPGNDTPGSPAPSPGNGDMPGAGRAAVRRLRAPERRSQLLPVALRLFAERGYDATTMDEIADAAGVTKPLLYQHFASKRALYRELVDAVAQELLDAIAAATGAAAGPREQVAEGFAAYFSLLVSHETAVKLLYGRTHPRDEELDSALRRVEEAIAEAIDPLIAAGLDAEHRRFLAYAVVGMAEGATRHWLSSPAGRRGGAESRREAARLAARLSDLAWAGLRSVHAD